MLPQPHPEGEAQTRRGCGPLIPPLTDTARPLRQQVFERIRSAGVKLTVVGK